MVITLNKHFYPLLLFAFVLHVFHPTWILSQTLNFQYTNLTTDQLSSGINPDFLIDSRGNFHLSYWERTQNRLVYATKKADEEQWIREYVDPDRAGGFQSSLFTDEQGTPHIAYLYNQNDLAYLAYAYKTENTWNTENVPISSDLGVYGFDDFFPSFAKASLDLTLTDEGQPLITYYDGSLHEIEILCIPIIRAYDEYDMFLGIAHKSQEGWNIIDTLMIPNKSVAPCLTDGDRFGEFNQLIPFPDGSYHIITNSLHNNELLLFSSHQDSLDTWNVQVLDSVNRFASSGADDLQKFRESFDYIDISYESDSIVHVVYGVSGLYGLEDRTRYVNATPFSRRTYFYMNFYPDSIGFPGYTPYYHELGIRSNSNNPNSHDRLYRTFHTLSTQGDSCIYAGHFNSGTGDIVINASWDQGRTWETDTLGQWVTNSPLQSQIWEDSLHIMFYDGLADHIIWASSPLDSFQWNIRPLFPNSRAGNILHTVLGEEEEIQFVYHEEISDQLYWGSYTDDSLIIEAIDTSGIQIAAAKNGWIEEDTPMIVYSSWQNGELDFAFRTENSWQYRQLSDSLLATQFQLAYSTDSLYLLYFDLLSQTLRMIKTDRALIQDEWITEIIPTEGERPELTRLHIDHRDQIHISYVEKLSNRLIYQTRTVESNSWERDTLVNKGDFQPGFHDIQSKSNGEILFAIRNESKNSIFLAERKDSEWLFETIPTGDANSIGTPMQLLIDDQDNPWLIYNQVTLDDELRFMSKQGESEWITYTSTGNQHNVAQPFHAHLKEQQLFLTGKKHNPGNQGLAFLTANVPTLTHTVNLFSESGVNVFPNPVQEVLTVEFSLPSSQPDISIFDLQGKTVSGLRIVTAPGKDSYTYEVNVSTLPNGLYFCKISTVDTTYIHKFIKTE